MINWDWMMKFKINKTFTKGSRTKIKNQKNKDWNWNTNNKVDRAVLFRREERKKTIILLMTNHPAVIYTCRTTGEGLNNASKNDGRTFFCYWKASHMHALAPHMLTCFFFNLNNI
jgi:hypothetical protein